jgi:hypothetical protein
MNLSDVTHLAAFGKIRIEIAALPGAGCAPQAARAPLNVSVSLQSMHFMTSLCALNRRKVP